MDLVLRFVAVVKRVSSWPSKAIRLYLNSEHHVRWSFCGQSYYVIRVEYPTTGILAIVKTTLQHVIYAVSKGYIPIVDLQNNRCQYQKVGEVGRVNTWEKFFVQPGGITLSEIPQQSNIILSSKRFAPFDEYFIDVSIVLPENRRRLQKIAKAFHQYIRTKDVVGRLIVDRCARVLEGCKGGKVLGVLCRGTDYTMRHPHGHPVQPSVAAVIKKVKEERTALGFTKIFLATEDRTVLDEFQNAFGAAVITIGQQMVELGDKQYISELTKMEYDFFEGPVAYMAAIYTLSRCNYFIGGMTAGTLTAFLLAPNASFEYEYVFSLGHYQ